MFIFPFFNCHIKNPSKTDLSDLLDLQDIDAHCSHLFTQITEDLFAGTCASEQALGSGMSQNNARNVYSGWNKCKPVVE